MKAREFDEESDAGVEDVTGDLDPSTEHPSPQETFRVTVEFPAWVVASLDREAERSGVTRESVVNTWIAERAAVPRGRTHRRKARDGRDGPPRGADADGHGAPGA